MIWNFKRSVVINTLLCWVTTQSFRAYSPCLVTRSSQLRSSFHLQNDVIQSTSNTKSYFYNTDNRCRIKVIGVGGGGSNAVARMPVELTNVGVEYWVINTDAQALARSIVTHRLQIGNTVSRGLGAGGNPEVGQRAAKESRDEIRAIVKDADLVFVTAGMGGGTGSGAAPLVAECAREAGALTVGVVTKPFGFEGRRRMQQAQSAIDALQAQVDTLIVVSNDRLLQIVPENTPLTEAFLVADDILRQGVVGISEIIVKPGLINVDFADVRTILMNSGLALMGVGRSGPAHSCTDVGGRAAEAARKAMQSPLLDLASHDAKGIVFNVVGGIDMTLQEINAVAEVIYENVDPDANIIFGALVDDKITNGEVTVTVLATGFSANPAPNVSRGRVAPSLPPPRVVYDRLDPRPVFITGNTKRRTE